jgi:putative transposase
VLSGKAPGASCKPGTSLRFAEHLALEGIASVGSVGDACDNALTVSVIGSTRSMPVSRAVPRWSAQDLGDVEFAIIAWVDWWNNRRLHSSIGSTPPAQAEAEYYRAPPASRPAALTT